MKNARFHGAVTSVAILFGLLLATSLCAAQNISGLDTLTHIQTRSFDIYYPAGLEEPALRLARFADPMLDELNSFFGIKLNPHSWGKDRIPVLLSDRSPYLNGYSIPYPSNRIVLYLAENNMTNELASMDDELYYTFLHELTHTVTLNMRSPLMALLARIFGDFISPAIWMMPDAVLEGTAVWVESNASTVTPGCIPENDDGNTGRLHDPSALEPVFSDLRGGMAGSIWSVSGLDDYPGAGSMAYHYGALFSQFLVERNGPETLARFWTLASDGNFSKGYDGTLVSKGIVEELTGTPEKALWKEFMAWLAEQTSAVCGRSDPEVEVAGRRVGAFAASGDSLFYVDLEQNAVFRLSIADATSENGCTEKSPSRLFAADNLIERLGASSDGRQLVVDWVRSGSHGEIIQAKYRFDFESGRLSLQKDREPNVEQWLPAMQEGAGFEGPAPTASGASAGSVWLYGLLRRGSQIVPARQDAAGNFELLRDAPAIVRSLSVQESSGHQEGDSTIRLALSTTQGDGLARLAIIQKCKAPDGKWQLFLQKDPPEGGIHEPVITTDNIVFYRAHLPGGERPLRWMRLDSQALARDFDCVDTDWVELSETDGAALKTGGAVSEANGAATQAGFRIASPALFPAMGSSSRYPYANGQSAGIQIEGSDLTERAAWIALAGWNYQISAPDLAFSLGFQIDRQYLNISLEDGPALDTQTQSAQRLSSLTIRDKLTWSLLPLWRRAWTEFQAGISGVQEDYNAGKFLAPDYAYANIGSRISIGYTTMRNSTFAPFDEKGLAVQAAVDYETIPGIASGWGASAGLELAIPAPALRFSVEGTCALGSGLSCQPAGRLLEGGGKSYVSSLPPAYPVYREYAALAAESPWYLFGEAEARLATFEAAPSLKQIRLPFLPALSFRRASLFGGFRASLLELDSQVEAPSSAFLRLSTDCTILAGMASMLHIEPSIELSLIFRPDLAKVSHMIDFGLGVSY
ncbi:MAG: hypothetical protein LLF89_09695 [Spirochaetaceae bacterium]|nr:hypothetical protein [Spirochaetaceae bacterium]